MPKPYPLKLTIKILEKQGFVFVSQRGSHAKYKKGHLVAIVPKHSKEIPYGTFRSILRQSHLKEGDFK